MVVVRLTLDHMRQEIAQAFSQFQLAQAGELDQAIDSAIRSFDFRGEVAKLLRPTIERFVESAVRSAMSDVLYDANLRAEVEKAVKQRLQKAVAEWGR